MRQRYYDPGLGRWLSADPIGFNGGLNLYSYVGQNPVNWVDPKGLQPMFPFLDPILLSEPVVPEGVASEGNASCPGARGGAFRQTGGNVFKNAAEAAQQEQGLSKAQENYHQMVRDFNNGKFEELPEGSRGSIIESAAKSRARFRNSLRGIRNAQEAEEEGLICPILLRKDLAGLNTFNPINPFVIAQLAQSLSDWLFNTPQAPPPRTTMDWSFT